ncbi:MAG: hypothetical protein R3Y32_06695 [Bacillota bacterium]
MNWKVIAIILAVVLVLVIVSCGVFTTDTEEEALETGESFELSGSIESDTMSSYMSLLTDNWLMIALVILACYAGKSYVDYKLR